MAKSNKKATATKNIETVTVEVKTSKVAKARVAFKISATPYDVALPEGFDFKVHKILKKKNFTTEALYYEHRVLEMEFKAEKFAALAEECRTMGSAADRRKKKQIVKLNSKMNELKAQLIAQGIDVEALIAAAAVTD